MKKIILVFAFLGLSVCVSAQLPTIHGYTVIPANPTANSFVKIVTHISTLNSSFGVDKTHTVTSSPPSIKLHLCYAEGLATVITNHIDTFAVGQLQPGGVYAVQLAAYMSSAGQHCAKVDSNFTAFTFSVSGSVGLNENASKSKLMFYPNPAKDYIIIKGEGNKTIRIFSLQGQLIRTGSTTANDRFSLEGLSAGMYLIEMTTAGQGAIRPIIVQ